MRRRSVHDDESDGEELLGIAEALQSLPLLDDLYFKMQALNLDLVDRFLEDQETALLREYMHLEKTPSLDAMFVSALSQLWVFGLYELLRTWRQRCKGLLDWQKELKESPDGERDALLAAKREAIEQRSATLTGVDLFHWEPYKRIATEASYGEKVRNAYDRSERLFRRIEAFRITLAKHEVPRSRGSFARAPGYGRINMEDGSISWEVVLSGKEVDRISRRDIARQCRRLASDTEALILPDHIQEIIRQFPLYSYGMKRVTLILDDGREVKGVYVSWSKEIVAIRGEEVAALEVDRVINARPEPGTLRDEVLHTEKSG